MTDDGGLRTDKISRKLEIRESTKKNNSWNARRLGGKE
jgi:hypothetical protein